MAGGEQAAIARGKRPERRLFLRAELLRVRTAGTEPAA